jgi:aminoglycoside phosphotransferase (APT) family kinase protein
VTPDPVLLGYGREADVFAVDAHRVLRRYRDGADATAEAAVMRHLAGQGFPVPRVYAATGPDLVIERLDGPTLLAALVGGRLDPVSGGRLLAGLHNRLHALPARPGAAAGDRLVHLDLHPDNVMLTAGGPVVIDWRNATDGPPELDVAMAALIVAQVGVDHRSDLAAPARQFLAAFLEHAGGDPRRALDRAVDRRRANRNQSAAERERIGPAAELIAGSAGRTA